MMRRSPSARSGGRRSSGFGRAGSAAVRLAFALLLIAAWPGCDRNVEPYDPTERVAEPDLRHIFPPAAESSARAGGAPPAMPAAPAAGVRGGAAGEGAPIRGRVELAPALREAAPAGAVLFVIARREGGGPPLAVKRIDAPRFPVDFELTPADRMIQALPWQGPLVLTARLDRDGNASSREPGDLQGRAREPIAPGAEGVRVVLDQRIE